MLRRNQSCIVQLSPVLHSSASGGVLKLAHPAADAAQADQIGPASPGGAAWRACSKAGIYQPLCLPQSEDFAL
jgi:hypothetical protein